jgi:hypothetical protein
MSLDIVILGEDGAPTRSAGLGVEAHAEVIRLAEGHGAAHVLRMGEYYEDVDFEASEIHVLLQELEEMRPSLSAKSALAIDDVLQVLREAGSKRVGVSAIAD